MNKVALVTGASSGIGLETAKLLHTHGFKVYGAARRVERMSELKNAGIEVLALDVTQEDSMVNCVEYILSKEGKLDVLINNAGYGSYGAIEDVPLLEAKHQFEVNIFGLARLTQLVLPKMREHKYGKIVNISSMGGKVYAPFGGWYHATKHALEGLSDCLRVETKGFGIDVIIVEPGGIKTEWGTIAADNLRKISGKGVYAQYANKTADSMSEMYTSDKLTDPIVIAKVILKAVTVKKPKTRYLKGYMSKTSVLSRKLFGDRVFDAVLRKMMM